MVPITEAINAPTKNIPPVEYSILLQLKSYGFILVSL